MHCLLSKKLAVCLRLSVAARSADWLLSHGVGQFGSVSCSTSASSKCDVLRVSIYAVHQDKHLLFD